MSKPTGSHQEGPILTEMEFVPGEPSQHGPTGGGVTNGVDGYPKGTPTKLPELSFDNCGAFGKVPKAKD